MLSSINFSHLSFCFEIDTIGMRVEKIFAKLLKGRNNAINETSSSFMYFYLFLFFGGGGGVQQYLQSDVRI